MANVDPSVREAYEAIRKPGSSETWAVFGYEGNKITTQQTGSGGIDNLVGHLQENQAQYAYIKYEVPVEETTRTKFVLISWVGESTSPLKKGKVSVDKPGLKAIVKDLSVELATSDKEDLSEEKLLAKIRSANY